MVKQSVTRRQKDISRVLRDRKHFPSVKIRQKGNKLEKKKIASGVRWSADDRKSIAAKGLTVNDMEVQLSIFRKGARPVRLDRPCIAGDGILVIPANEHSNLLSSYEDGRRTRSLIKFVPASGAASRMFREWHQYLAADFPNDDDLHASFAEELGRYAFFNDLAQTLAASGQNLKALIKKREFKTILKSILTDEGLNYGYLPKALLKFHAYPDAGRTALEEHLVEAAQYAKDSENVSRVHFTVSPEHESAVRTLLSRAVPEYASRLNTVFDVDISTQDQATDTIAVDPENRPFRDARRKLVFRPGGHGSLLHNLNLLDEDVVFVKNIDNTVPDRLKGESSRWKKLLAGYLMRLQRRIFSYVRLLAEGNPTDRELEEMRDFAEKTVNIGFPIDFREFPRSERRSCLLDKLNRPLRVCGMVKNEGEPGGGPFWVKDADGIASPQIIEESQTDQSDPDQRRIWFSATHFNPVDLVCGVRDWQGKKFDLADFIDPATVVITRKSEKGKDIIALERPGLWNGSMALWNTVFVEVPVATFNPVKTITDLLRPQHLPA